MTTLDQTSQVVRALLGAVEPAGVAEVDQAVWASPSAHAGLRVAA